MEIILRKALLPFQTEFYRLYNLVKILVKYSINAWLHFTNNKLHRRIDQPNFINQYTKLVFCSNNSFFIVSHPKIFHTNLLY